ncbi:MAG: tRNA threonylcarbamoyladenosine dehydratase [Coprobacillus sp.]|nr:tRNA threonylcarbamoyladenosine dehydratase [Coprobacillus sp.]
MKKTLERTALIYGKETLEALENKKVMVVGLGGVGGYVVEALTRMGIGHFILIDHDVVSESNINRQLIATYQTIGQKKIDVMKERMLTIQPEVDVKALDMFVLPENIDSINFEGVDYIVDAIDCVTAKIALILKAKELNIPIISSMGTGNKVNPALLEITDIYKTSMCPLAKVMRHELKKRGIKKLKVLYSKEEQQKNIIVDGKKRAPGSTPFVPSSAGLLIASEVTADLIDDLKESL